MAIVATDNTDPDTGNRARGGGKLKRSETVTVRLDPRLNYLSELAARAQRRTKSSFIEWAVEAALMQVTVPGTSDYQGHEQSIEDLSTRLWDVDEPDRLAALAFHAPILMTHEEQVLWKHIREYGYLWRGRFMGVSGDDEEEWRWQVTEDSLVMDRLRANFELLKLVSQGMTHDEDGDPAPLPSYAKKRKKPAPTGWGAGADDDLDSEIPF